MRTHSTFAALALMLVTGIAACADQGDDTSDDLVCDEDGKCDSAASVIKTFHDPAFTYIASVQRKDGTIPGDYAALLEGVGQQMNCDQASQHSFSVLSNHEYSPKVVLTRCSTYPERAAGFFMVLGSHQQANEKDTDPNTFHIASWDDSAGLYRTALLTKKGNGLSVKVAPNTCLSCHGGLEGLKTWQPLMNVMTVPWSQWNAKPGFGSHLFDESVPASYKNGKLFNQFLSGPNADSASNLEPIVRAGIDRVVNARVKARRAPADLQKSLELIRPVFCDETVNMVSEEIGTTLFKSSVVVDDGIRLMFQQVRPDNWPWGWLNDGKFKFYDNSPQTLTMMPVRGESTVQAELGLVTRGVLTAEQVLQVRALDWQHPVYSDFRCGLYRTAFARLTATGAVVPKLAAGATNTEMVAALYGEIMKKPNGISMFPRKAAAGKLYQIADATKSDGFAQLQAATAVDLNAFGAMIDVYANAVQAMPRSQLAGERKRRVCKSASFGAASIVADVVCN
jgi:hypothetical protein